MALTLKINVVEKSVTKTLQFDPSTSCEVACRIIRDKCSDYPDLGQSKDYGLFLPGEAYGTGAWLEPFKTLDYYLLRNLDTLEYRRKIRTLRVRTLDDTNKTMMVDDSQPVANLMVVICTKMGITNHDEYSLVRDIPDENDNPNTQNHGTLTLRRKREERERDPKMQQLRKKLKTDDEMNWVDHTKTLREQGVEEWEVLILRRKFFYSDQNIDAHDPIQLNLLYVQARDAILDGTHPVTQDKACEFAGIQCQIQFGDHNAQRHRTGFLDLKDFLPASYVRNKGVEKKIYIEHRRHLGMSDLEAKSLYTKNARGLQTYGVTFFLVKEKMDGKNKLIPRLLGVTKDSVLRLDEKTKEIYKVYPLTTVRRWAASPNTFTLDLGDYTDQYFSAQTTEGEQIAQLIAGYIDIILKRKQAKDHLGIEGDEGSTLVEESVSPFRATIVQRQGLAKATPLTTDSIAKPGVMHAGPEGIQTIQTGSLSMSQQVTVEGRLDRQYQSTCPMQQYHQTDASSTYHRAFTSGQEAVIKSREYLDQPLSLPPFGSDPASRKWVETTLDSRKQNVQSQIAAMNAATAHVVLLTSSEEVNQSAVSDAVSAITSGLPDVAKDVRMIAALHENNETIVEATRKLCFAFSDLLTAAEPDAQQPRQELLSAAGRVGDASRALLSTIGESDESQDLLLGFARDVANTSATLVVQVRKCAGTIEDTVQREQLVSSAAKTALSASELVACAKVVAPTISNEKCRDELTDSARRVARSVEEVLTVSNQYVKETSMKQDLQGAAREVSESLNKLLDHMRPRQKVLTVEHAQEGAVDTILLATDKIITSEDPSDMVRQARILAHATAQLIQAIKGEAEKTPDSDQQKKLIAAAKVLAEATSKLVEAAKACASNPATNSQDVLRQAAQDLREATNMAAGGAVHQKSLRRLEMAAKNAASAATQVISASQSAAQQCNNATVREALTTECKTVADTIPPLVSAVKASLNHSENSSQLMETTERFIYPSNSLITASKKASGFVEDDATSRHLNVCTQKFALELVELRTALDRVAADTGSSAASQPKKQFDAVADRALNFKDEIGAFRSAANSKDLRPLPGDTVLNSVQRLTSSVRKLSTCTNQLTNSVIANDASNSTSSAQSTLTGLSDLVAASRAVAATSNDTRVLLATEEVVHTSWILIKRSSEYVGRNENPKEIEAQLAPLNTAIHDALNKVSESIPGQKDLEQSIQLISSVSETYERRGRVQTGKNYGQLQAELQKTASDVSESASGVMNHSSNPGKLGSEARQFSQKVESLTDSGTQLAYLQEDAQVRDEINLCLKNITNVGTNMLMIAKSVSLNADAPGARNQLVAAVRNVNECLNQLLDACSTAAPGQKECENAVRKIRAMKTMLDNPNEPINSLSYFECQQIVVENSKLLGDSMTGIANHAKDGYLEQFGKSVHSAADAICGLVESSAQAAYLLGAADPTSVAGKQGLVDMHSINDSARHIKAACQVLTSSKVTQQQVLGSATTIAKHTSSLCTSCRIASEKTSDATTKRQFVQMAKDVANATASLVKEIKALDNDQSGTKKETCNRATASLIKSVDALVQYASQPEFLSMPAKISVKGRSLQEPVVTSGKNVIEGSCNMLQAAKSLAINPKDPPTWQQLAQHSKHVSDSIKKLVTALREKAPGQRDCEIAVQRLNEQLRRLNEASLAAVSQSLSPLKDNNLQGFVQNAETVVRNIEEHVEPVRQAGRAEAENLGHQVSSLVTIVETLVSNIIGVASHWPDSREQVNILERSRTVLESGIQLVCAAKESGGNSKATNLHPELDLSAQCFQEGVDDLKMTLEQISSGVGGLVTFINENISAAMVKLNQPNTSSSTDSYADYQTRMIYSAKEIAKLSSEMVAKAMIESSLIPAVSSDINQHYGQLASDARGAIATIASQEVGVRIRCGVQELGKACIDMVRTGGAAQFSPDQFTHRDLMDINRQVSEKVSDILSALQAGSRGTQACINAASTVSGIIGDLDTTIMFATAGTLHAEGDETFANQRENILKTAKALVEDTKTLVAGAASTQEQLAVAAQNAVATIVQLSEAVKFGAASLGSNNPESQVMLINAVRDVAGALYDLIHATKSAAGKGQSDPSMMSLKESAKIMVTNVTSLLKTVKAVEDEHTRGTRALEATIEAIAQEIRALESPEAPRGRAITPEELVRATKPVTGATAKAVAAGSSCKQEDVIVAANVGRKVMADLLAACKTASFGVEGDIRDRLLMAAKQIALSYRELLQIVMHAVLHPGTEVKPQLSQASKEIAQAVTELVAVGQLMKGAAGYADPDDPTVIAENELLGAANSIDAAAKKLEKLRPRRTVEEADETLNFDEMILEAAKSIAAATSALVKAACAAQRELIDSGKMSRKPGTDSDDGQWSDGLISAAQMVAAATHSLVEAANALCQGHASEEKLISAAKQVASSTAQLLVACKVKASPDSDSTRRLQAAGNAVKRATDNLVKAAQQALAQDEEHQFILSKKMVGGIAQEIDARTDVLRIEKELEEARSKLAAIRKAKYVDKVGGGEYSESESEIEVHENSRLDNLLESSAERIHSANNAFSIMREQHHHQANVYNQSQNHFSSTAVLKPAVLPKPTNLLNRDRHAPSPAYSTVSNESSSTVSYQTVQGQQMGSFSGNRLQTSGGEEDLYARPGHPHQHYTASSIAQQQQQSGAPKVFMKPSEFLGSSPLSSPKLPVKSGATGLPQQGNNAGAHFGVPLRSVQAPGGQHQHHQLQESRKNDMNEEEYQEETSHYDSGPVSSEEVYETALPGGGVSLKKVFTKQQTSTTKNVVSSTKKIVHKSESSSSSSK